MTQILWKVVLSLRSKVPEQLRSRGNMNVAVILASIGSVRIRLPHSSRKSEKNIWPHARLWWYAHGNSSTRRIIRRFDNFNAGSFDLPLAWSQFLYGCRTITIDSRCQSCIQTAGRILKMYVPNIVSMKKLRSNVSYGITGKEYWPSASNRVISSAAAHRSEQKALVMPKPTMNTKILKLNIYINYKHRWSAAETP